MSLDCDRKGCGHEASDHERQEGDPIGVGAVTFPCKHWGCHCPDYQRMPPNVTGLHMPRPVERVFRIDPA